MKASIDRDANVEGRRAKATVLQAALTTRRGPADSVPGVLAMPFAVVGDSDPRTDSADQP
jgi:hypothetical protein